MRELHNGFELKPYSVLLMAPDSESGSSMFEQTCWAWVWGLTPTHAAYRARRQLARSRSSCCADDGEPIVGPEAAYQPDEFAPLLVIPGHVKDDYEPIADVDEHHAQLEAEALGRAGAS